MSMLVADCPRCGACSITFDISSAIGIPNPSHWQRAFEAFSICRNCHKSTVFILAVKAPQYTAYFEKVENVITPPISLNETLDIFGYVSKKNEAVFGPPEHVPSAVGEAFTEGAVCFAAECYNAAAAMFRLALDLATEPLLPPESGIAPLPNTRQRRDLGLRVAWLFDVGRLPPDLKDLADCIREDGNDGVHRGSLKQADAEDLVDFTIQVLTRLYTEPRTLELAKERRIARRNSSKQ